MLRHTGGRCIDSRDFFSISIGTILGNLGRDLDVDFSVGICESANRSNSKIFSR
jgi:hypothetical protein